MGNNILLHLFTVEPLNFIQAPLLLKSAAVTMDSVETKAPYTLQILVIINDSIIILTFLDGKKVEKVEKNNGELFFI